MSNPVEVLYERLKLMPEVKTWLDAEPMKRQNLEIAIQQYSAKQIAKSQLREALQTAVGELRSSRASRRWRRRRRRTLRRRRRGRS